MKVLNQIKTFTHNKTCYKGVSYHILLIGPDGNTAKDLLSLFDS